jgi:hypothetical protein
MTPADHHIEPGDCGVDAGAYVLGALEPAEAEAFRSHLASCAVCRDEVGALKALADGLPLAAPHMPAPRGLKRRVMADVRNHPKTAPGLARSRSRRPVLARPAMALGLALVVVAAIAGGLALAPGRSSGVRLVQASVVGQPGTAVVRLAAGQAELIVRHMPGPPEGKIYEVWLKRDGQAPSPTNALFSVSSTGAGTVAVPGQLRGVSEVLVTPEPSGGSRVPTHAPVIVARLG